MKFPQVAIIHWEDPQGPEYFQIGGNFNPVWWDFDKFSIIEVHKYIPTDSDGGQESYLGHKSSKDKELYSFHPSNLTFLGEL